MVVTTYGQSQSPGNEQRDYWTSASADRKGSRNIVGIKNAAVDALVDAIIYADNQQALTIACRALDRVLWHGYYLVPNWHSANHRLAYAAKLKHPKILPLYHGYDQWLIPGGASRRLKGRGAGQLRSASGGFRCLLSAVPLE